MAHETHSWRTSPFVLGRRYRARRDFKALRDAFSAGDNLLYESDAYSAYHGFTGYVFSQVGSDKKRAWDIHDDEDLASFSAT